MHINACNAAVAVGGIVVDTFVCVAAACVNSLHILAVVCFDRTLDLFHLLKYVEELLYVFCFGFKGGCVELVEARTNKA